MIELAQVNKIADWPKIRRDIESAILAVLGKFPKKRIDLQMKTVDESAFPGFVRKRVNYFVSDWERITAWLFVPENKEETPAILCCHQEVPQGKDEPAGVGGERNLAFAQHYASKGYVTLAPDSLTAGERKPGKNRPFDTQVYYESKPALSAMGKMLWDHMHAIDLLTELQQVDSERLGVIGHAFGGANALFLAAFDERIKACVASCAFSRFQDDPNPGRWVNDGGFQFMPALKDAAKSGKFPFDWEHILSLCAPTPTLLLTALNDETLANTKSCETAVQQAKQVYGLLGADDALVNETHDEGRTMNRRQLDTADEWFERWL